MLKVLNRTWNCLNELRGGHWGVEVNLHWHQDFTFRDDKNTSMAV